jgi:5-oxoprolinase (ATP-hydrolysing)
MVVSMDALTWLIATDTGGTFTDCYGLDPAGSEHRCKVLSSGRLRTLAIAQVGPRVVKLRDDWGAADHLFTGFAVHGDDWESKVAGWHSTDRLLELTEDWPSDVGFPALLELSSGEASPVVGARILTNTPSAKPFPPLEFRLATTLATNALLEGKAAPVVLFVTQGFGDLLAIGDQRRQDLFALRHQPRPQLASRVVEVSARMNAHGEIIQALAVAELRAAAESCVAAGFTTAAVALVHSFVNPEHERAVAEILTAVGFTLVSLSSTISPLIRLLPRAETAVVNAALSPVMDHFVQRVRGPLGDSVAKFSCLTSAGGLADSQSFRAVDSLLSGPAGGVGGCAAVAQALGVERILTLDMGGTSTDVARWEGDFLYQFEQRVGAASIMAPALRIETVAAGGGSICHVTPAGLAVGPQSAGADPGPACYGRGGPLTLTDVNLLLGRLDATKAAVPLWPEPARIRLLELQAALAAHGWPVPEETALLEGLLDIALERMAEAVRRISVREGCDPRQYALMAFGGAGPQHACALADRLGIATVFVPRQAGLLSAFGAAQARREEFISQQVLRLWSAETQLFLNTKWSALESELVAKLPGGRVERRLVEVRLQGQDSCLLLEVTTAEEIPKQFAVHYQAIYSYPPPANRALEIVSLRFVAALPTAPLSHEFFSQRDPILGPHAVQDGFSTLIVEPGWTAITGSDGTWKLQRSDFPNATISSKGDVISPVAAELFRCRLAGLVEGMGAMLQRTAISTNVKERLDFSCALLDASGRLAMNAPHIPVHLGALGECVRRVVQDIPPSAGQLLVTNDPAHGGSHLPDITVICPVFYENELIGYTANRAHHAELGGIAPGSMPAFAKNLAEEGVLVPPMILAEGDNFHEDEIRNVLLSAAYPTRAVADNLADLRAQAAAARQGATALQSLCTQHGSAKVRQHLAHLCQVAAAALPRKLLAIDFTHASATQRLDDGWPISVTIHWDGQRLRIDFTGSGPVHPGSRNATTAVVRSAVLYALRLWLAEDLPLNEGVLEHVDLILPPGFLNPTFSADPRQSPAVVAGNVETSQRVVDTLLQALQVQAGSQGTMNNVIFGNATYGHYETLGGGAGAGEGYAGASALHTHMTNTAITDAEILEHRYPVRIEQFSIRPNTGGNGKWNGGNGLIRAYRFLAETTLSLLTEHRTSGPDGMAGGSSGTAGKQTLTSTNGTTVDLPGNITLQVPPGSLLTMQTPGGGGWGHA